VDEFGKVENGRTPRAVIVRFAMNLSTSDTGYRKCPPIIVYVIRFALRHLCTVFVLT
jgi:hypothetical protein